MTAAAPTGLVQFVFTAPESDKVEEVGNSIDKEIKNLFQDYKESDVSKDEINGLQVFTTTIVGKINSVNMTGMTFAFVNDKGRIMIVNAFVPTDSFDAQKDAMVGIMKTIKGA